MPHDLVFARIFPPPARPSPLLLDFATWHATSYADRYTTYELVPSRLDDFWIEDGSDLAGHFAPFMQLGDGSMVGHWYPHGPASVVAPIVLLGSEGQTEILADDLEGLLARIALGAFEDDGPLGSFLPFEDDEDEDEGDAPDLAAWLRARLGREDLNALVPVRGAYSDLQGWMDAWQEARLQAAREDPVLVRIGELLESYRPKEAWRTTDVHVSLVGDRYEARLPRHGPQPLPEAAALEPLLREARAARVARVPERGAWFVATVRLSHDGTARIVADFEREPDFHEGPPGAEEYAADLRAFPRSAAWTPAWLAAKLGL
ncbi:hypothetical protein [Deinococcus pimensis]|uniref:hypothetical protein n=1 Tax=Deinococcus pimensis TaxID=309888 RepID=UPI0004B9970A|nr:hypothetical protein [Deinococcus pimensis]